MDGVAGDDIPCSSLAVDSFLRLGALRRGYHGLVDVSLVGVSEVQVIVSQPQSFSGSAWGIFVGPYEARKRGLTGFSRAVLVARSVGKYGFQCGLFAGVLSATSCGIQRYRMQKDWVNASVAGAVTGALLAAKTRSWVQVFTTAAAVSGIATVADHWRKI